MVKPDIQKKKIFYIEKVSFLRSMMEFALRAHGAEIYSVDTLDNNFYLLEDLTPDLIIFDLDSIGENLEKIKEYSTRAVLVATGNESQQASVSDQVKMYLIKPLQAKNIAVKILSLLD